MRWDKTLRRTVLVVWAILLWAGLMTPTAGGTDPVDQQVLTLQSQGYTHFQVTRRLLSTAIEAYAPFGSHMHLELANDNGGVLEITAQQISVEDYARAVAAIRNLAAGQNRKDPPDGVLGPLMQMLSSSVPAKADISGIDFEGPGDDGGDTAKNDKTGDRDAPDQDRDGGDGGDSDSDHGDHDSDNGDDD